MDIDDEDYKPPLKPDPSTYPYIRTCDKCYNMTITINSNKNYFKFQAHCRNCVGNNGIECTKCFKIFKNLQTFKYHQQNINCTNDETQKETCTGCFKQFKNKKHLRYHHHHLDIPRKKRKAKYFRKRFTKKQIIKIHKYCYENIYQRLIYKGKVPPFTIKKLAKEFYKLKFKQGDTTKENKWKCIQQIERLLQKYPQIRERLLNKDYNKKGGGYKFNLIRWSIENIIIRRFENFRYEHRREVYIQDIADWYVELINKYKPEGKTITWDNGYERARKFMKRNNIVLHKPKGSGLDVAYPYLACLSSRWIKKSQQLMQKYKINSVNQIWSQDETHVFEDKSPSKKILSYKGDNQPIYMPKTTKGFSILGFWNPIKLIYMYTYSKDVYTYIYIYIND